MLRPTLSRATALAASTLLAACAHFGGAPKRYGAFSSELEARSLASTFHCDMSTFKDEYAARRQQPVAVGAPFCLVLARYGDPEYVDKNDVVDTGVARVRYRVDRNWYRVTATRRAGDWTVTAATTTRR